MLLEALEELEGLLSVTVGFDVGPSSIGDDVGILLKDAVLKEVEGVCVDENFDIGVVLGMEVVLEVVDIGPSISVSLAVGVSSAVPSIPSNPSQIKAMPLKSPGAMQRGCAFSSRKGPGSFDVVKSRHVESL